MSKDEELPPPMVDRPESGAIPTMTASREGLALARSILGTADSRQIVAEIDSFCAVYLGSEVAEKFFCELSVGAAFGLRLRDGRRVLLKVHPPDAVAF